MTNEPNPMPDVIYATKTENRTGNYGSWSEHQFRMRIDGNIHGRKGAKRTKYVRADTIEPVTDCEVCEGHGRIEVEPDSIETHPCDTCRPEMNKEYQRGVEYGVSLQKEPVKSGMVGKELKPLPPSILENAMKPYEVNGDKNVFEKRMDELTGWFDRLSRGSANGNWLRSHAFELVAAVYRLRSEALQQSAWQDISTAPKDGTEIDVWLNGMGFRQTNISWREPDEDEQPWQDNREPAFRDNTGYRVKFTHWQPLPLPPTKDGE